MRTVLALLAIVGLLGAPAFAQPGSPFSVHIQLSSAMDQTPGVLGAPVIMEQIDSQNGVDFDGLDTVRILTGGLYFVVAAPQIRDAVATKSKKKKKKGQSCLDFWLRVNPSIGGVPGGGVGSVDIPNSNVQLCFPDGKNYTDVIVAQAILQLNEEDTLQVIASAPFEQGAFLDAITVPGEPLIPSIIFSLFRIR